MDKKTAHVVANALIITTAAISAVLLVKGVRATKKATLALETRTA